MYNTGKYVIAVQEQQNQMLPQDFGLLCWKFEDEFSCEAGIAVGDHLIYALFEYFI